MNTNAEVVQAVMEWATARLGEPLNVGILARRAGYSIHHFSRLFSARVGESPAEWIERRRIEQAERMLLATSMKILEIALECGFNDSATFARAFRRQTGMPPSRFRSTGIPPRAETAPTTSIPGGIITESWVEPVPGFRLCGLLAEVRQETGIPGNLWARLLAEVDRAGLDRGALEFRQLAFWTEDAEERFTCLAGFIADAVPHRPVPFAFIEIPPSTCLFFRVPGTPERLAPAYREIYGTLLPGMTWRPTHPYVFERYPCPNVTEIGLPLSPPDGFPSDPGQESASGLG